ncbi:MAG: bifunctional riboflavin kinase/FAD synthetase [Candidatus Omnitrophota bacterium]
MKDTYNLPKLKSACVSIGIFDGVHRGHQKILKKLVNVSKSLDAVSVAVTFDPHPRKVLNPASNVPFLTSFEHRLRLIKELGIGQILVVKFTKSLSRMDADGFIKKVLMRRFDIKAIVVGKDFLFGSKKKGDFLLLKRLSKIYRFRLFGIKSVRSNKEYVSSTRIRSLVESGDLREASKLLGRRVTVLGTVVKGRKIGRVLGFPTANIDPHHEAIPPSGVYAVSIFLNNRDHRGVLNIGRRPTFLKNSEPTIELHILDFKKNIYNRDIEIAFIKKIRDEIRFDSAEKLKKRILVDIKRVRELRNI